MAARPFPLSWRCHDEVRFQLTKLKHTQKELIELSTKYEVFRENTTSTLAPNEKDAMMSRPSGE